MTRVHIREHFREAEGLSPAWLEAAGEILRTEVCRTQNDLIRVQEEWRAALTAKGWS
jgi:hypothetical protein